MKSCKNNYYINMFFLFLCSLVFLVSCKEEEEFLTISVSELNIPSKGEEQNVNISTNVAWSAMLTPAESSSWVRLSTSSGDANTSTVRITFSENETDKERSAEVIFHAGKETQTLKITQKEKATLVVTDREWYLSQVGGKWPFPISRNIDYTFSISPEAQSWLHLSETKAVTTDTLYLTIDENITSEMREGFIYLRASDASVSDTIVVMQQELLLTVSTEQLDFASEADTRKLIVNSTHIDTNYKPVYTYALEPETTSWCQVKKSEDATTLTVSVSGNDTGQPREANLKITSSAATKTIRILQQEDGLTYYADGEYVQLQKATIGKGVNIALMGDGYIKADLVKGGKYENVGHRTMEAFFNVEPYKSNRDYFNVYMIFAQSKEAGVSEEIAGVTVNNRFESEYGSGTVINWNKNLCADYLDYVTELDDVIEMTTILFLNSSKYAGTAYISSNGFCIAACPVSTEAPPYDFEGLVHHEAGGHAFGLLADEYYYNDEKVPEDVTDELALWQEYNCYLNISSTNNLSRVPWHDFIGKEKYAHVGAYEGGYYYKYGIWRSEVFSCMDENIPYFNAQSRWTIVNRIKRLAGVSYTFDEFVKSDHVEPWPVMKAVPLKSFRPLGKPILKISKTTGRL